MLISKKSHDANRENAQHSTGPTSEAGKAAVRHNALKYGLRTRATILPWESETHYFQLWDELEAEWQPQTRTERAYLETMVTSQWLLRRMAVSEKQILTEIRDSVETQYKLLASVYKFRALLERQFRQAIADMLQSRARQQAVPEPRPIPVREPQPIPVDEPRGVAEPHASASGPPSEPSPTWLMSAPPGVRPIVICSLPSPKPDTR